MKRLAALLCLLIPASAGFAAGGSTDCGEKQSCVPVTKPMACYKLPHRVLQCKIPTASDCGLGVNGAVAADALPACEAFASAQWTPPRMRAAAYFNLGFGYLIQQLALMETRGDITKGKPQGFSLMLKSWDKSLAIEPNNAEHLVTHGNYRSFFMGQHQEAVHDFDRAIQLDPSLWRAHSGRAQALARLAKSEMAIEQGKRAIALAPFAAESHSALGFAYHAGNHFEEAATEYRAAIGYYVEPSRPEPPLSDANPWLGLAEALHNLGRSEEAADTLTQYLSKMPQQRWRGYMLLIRAKYHEAARSFDQAAADIALARSLNGYFKSWEYPFRRAKMLIKANRGREAREDVRLGLRLLTQQEILELQILLNSAGLKTVVPTGVIGQETEEGFLKCFDDEHCIGALGRGV